MSGVAVAPVEMEMVKKKREATFPPAKPPLVFTRRPSSRNSLDLDNFCLNTNSNPHQSFNLRMYVLSVRSRDFAKCWPFSNKCLQKCLQRGETPSLPPFETLRHDVEVDQIFSPEYLSKESIGDKQTMDRNGDNISYNEDRIENLSEKSLEYDCIKGDKSEHTASISGGGREEEYLKSLEFSRRSKSSEDAPIYTSLFRDTLVPQACPLCRSFTSASNTALNAHIDQCLETIPRGHAMNASKNRTKVKKMRSMADICAVAPTCSLEDLERTSSETEKWTLVKEKFSKNHYGNLGWKGSKIQRNPQTMVYHSSCKKRFPLAGQKGKHQCSVSSCKSKKKQFKCPLGDEEQKSTEIQCPKKKCLKHSAVPSGAVKWRGMNGSMNTVPSGGVKWRSMKGSPNKLAQNVCILCLKRIKQGVS